MAIPTTSHAFGTIETKPRKASEFDTFKDWELNCLARLFSSLGDPSRLTILKVLHSNGAQCVGDLAAATQLSPSATSHQLRILRDRELISARRSGRSVRYSISDDHVSMLLDIGLEHAMEDCSRGRRPA